MPKFKGANIKGSEVVYFDISVNQRFYLVSGIWGEWGDYDACDVSCGGGATQRYRICACPPLISNYSPEITNYSSLDCYCQRLDGIRVRVERQSNVCNTYNCPSKLFYMLKEVAYILS